MPRWSWFSTTATWNWRGSRMMAKAESSVVTPQTAGSGRVWMTEAIFGFDCAAWVRSPMPPLSPQTTKAPTAEKRRELDDQLDRDGEDEAVLMLLRIDPPRAEGDGEGGEHQRDRQRERGRRRVRRQPRLVEGCDDRQQRGRGRLELQRDIRRGADKRDERGDRRDRLRLAVAGRHEVGDRGQVLRPRQIGDAPDERARRGR